MILRSTEALKKLDGFDMPELDSRFLVITASNIIGNNEINIMGTKMPLLASDFIAYKGQPLLVLFGPDYENTELALEKIKVKTSPLDFKEDTSDFPDPLFFSWGLDENGENDEERQQMKKVESSFELESGDEESFNRFPILSWQDSNGMMHVECPSQWQSMVKACVASALNRSQETITLHPDKYSGKYDEYLIGPAMYASFTSIATLITGMPCEMRESGIATRPGISFHTVTWIDKNGKPRHEETTVVIDQGYWAIMGKEVQRQIMVNILPKYSLESFKAMIRTQKSSKRPSVFCGSMVHAAALSSRGIHTSRLALKLDLTPSSFILDTNKDATRFTDWAPRHDLTDLEEKVRKISEESDFDRKWSSSSLHSGQFGLQGYLYGIGLSSGLSTAGFSTTTAKENQFMAQLSYTTKKNVTVSGYFPQTLSGDRSIKEILGRTFSSTDQTELVLFIEGTQKAPDSGPDILSTYSSIFLTQLMKATMKLSQLAKKEDAELPITLRFNSQNLALPCEFEYSGFGTAVVEVEVPKTSLIPEVKNVWIDTAIALPQVKGIDTKIKSIALVAFESLGVKLANNFNISVKYSSERKDVGTYSSVENLVRSLVTSALASAIWQATGQKSGVKMPYGDKAIERYLGEDE